MRQHLYGTCIDTLSDELNICSRQRGKRRPEGSIYSSGGLTRNDELGEARRLWRSPSST